MTVNYVMVDLDGTIADTTHRRSLIDKGREGGPDWRAYSMACAGDRPIRENVFLCRALAGNGFDIVLASGRDEAARGITKDWLNRYSVRYDRLFMRPEGDRTGNVALKLRFAAELAVQGFRLAFAIDDYPAVLAALEAEYACPTLLAWSDGRRYDLVQMARDGRLSATAIGS